MGVLMGIKWCNSPAELEINDTAGVVKYRGNIIIEDKEFCEDILVHDQVHILLAIIGYLTKGVSKCV